MFGSVHNTYFAQSWWERLTDDVKSNLIRLTATVDASTHELLSDHQYVDWRISDVTWRHDY
jgi:hypothetical protein